MPSLLPNLTPEERLLVMIQEQGAFEKLAETNEGQLDMYHFLDLYTPFNDLLLSMQATLENKTSEWSGKRGLDSLKPVIQELQVIQERMYELSETVWQAIDDEHKKKHRK